MTTRRLHLDFVRPAAPRSRAGWPWLLLGIVAVSLSLLQWKDARMERQRLQASLSASQQAAAARPAPARLGVGALMQARLDDPKQFALDVDRANGVIAALSVPWKDLFAEIEAAADPRVALLSIQPEAEGRRLRIAGEARRFQDVLDYLGRLQARGGLANVVLLSHEVRAAGAARGGSGTSAPGSVGFVLVADWTGRS